MRSRAFPDGATKLMLVEHPTGASPVSMTTERAGRQDGRDRGGDHQHGARAVHRARARARIARLEGSSVRRRAGASAPALPALRADG